MRMLMTVIFPNEPFNTYVRDGSIGAKVKKILDAIKPEAAYFSEIDGHRGAHLIVNLPDASHVPLLAEPFFLSFNADVKLRIVMSPEDLAKSGIDTFGPKW